jgi:hypothetical protein
MPVKSRARRDAVAHFSHDKKIAHIKLDQHARDQLVGHQELEAILGSIYYLDLRAAGLLRLEHGQDGGIVGGKAQTMPFITLIDRFLDRCPAANGRARFLKLDAAGYAGLQVRLDHAGKFFRQFTERVRFQVLRLHVHSVDSLILTTKNSFGNNNLNSVQINGFIAFQRQEGLFSRGYRAQA